MSAIQSDIPWPPQKRQRQDNNEDPRQPSEYWFEDGNIVLQAEHTLFRVHRSILSRRSQFFNNMFSMPHTLSQGDKHLEGCPVVLLPDLAEDVSNIMSLLYDGEKTFNFGRNLPARVLGSMLRLGRRYSIASFEDRALSCMHHDYPTILGNWDAVHIDSLSSHRQIGHSDGTLSTTKEIISIAHEFRISTVLPAAYVNYLQHQEDIEAVVKDASIPNKAREACIIGNARILEYVKEKMATALCSSLILPSITCSITKCGVNKSQTIKNLPIWAIVDGMATRIFDPWETMSPMLPEYLCSACRGEVEKLTNGVRMELWFRLPLLFGLPCWTHLTDDL